MSKISEYGDFEMAPEGDHTATLVRFVDLGQQETKFGRSRMASLTFELADVVAEGGDALLAFKTIFNLSSRSKNFRNIVQALTNLKDIGDVETASLVGKGCTVSIEHVTTEDGATFANVEVKKLKPGAKAHSPTSGTIFFSLQPEDFDAAVLERVPERQRDRIKASVTYKGTLAVIALKGKAARDVIGDDFPANLGGWPTAGHPEA